MDAGLNLFNLKKAFGNQNYTIAELSYRDKILNHPLINGLWTMGPAFVIVVNTKTWAFEMVTGESDSISGFNIDEIMNLQGKFLMDFPVENSKEIFSKREKDIIAFRIAFMHSRNH
jgi:hypothetical protein